MAWAAFALWGKKSTPMNSDESDGVRKSTPSYGLLKVADFIRPTGGEGCSLMGFARAQPILLLGAGEWPDGGGRAPGKSKVFCALFFKKALLSCFF
jgi:hypothetical protein